MSPSVAVRREAGVGEIIAGDDGPTEDLTGEEDKPLLSTAPKWLQATRCLAAMLAVGVFMMMNGVIGSCV